MPAYLLDTVPKFPRKNRRSLACKPMIAFDKMRLRRELYDRSREANPFSVKYKGISREIRGMRSRGKMVKG